MKVYDSREPGTICPAENQDSDEPTPSGGQMYIARRGKAGMEDDRIRERKRR